MILEIAHPKEFRRIAEITNNAYRGLDQAPGWTDEVDLVSGRRTSITALTALAEQMKSTLLVMKIAGEIVGNVMLQTDDQTDWFLSMLAVDPRRQLDGIGKKIVATAEQFAHRRGGTAMQLAVMIQRPLLASWYLRQGYTRTGRIERFPYDDPTVGIALRNDLALTILRKLL